MIDIFLLRHGHVTANRPRRFFGQGDPSMTREGRTQMEEWSTVFTDKKIQILSSDLKRCREGAEVILASHQDQELALEPDFREINLGSWEGLTVEEVERKFPGAYRERGADMGGYVPEGGESFAMLQRRAMSALERAIQTRKPSNGPLVIVTHIGISRVIIARILQMPLAAIFRIEHHYARAHLIRLNESRYTIVGMNLPFFAADAYNSF